VEPFVGAVCGAIGVDKTFREHSDGDGKFREYSGNTKEHSGNVQMRMEDGIYIKHDESCG